MGVIALLTSTFDETSVRILLTTVVVGSASVLTLCYLAVVGSRYVAAACVGGAAALVSAGAALLMTWSAWDGVGDALVQTFGVATVAALSLAQVCLLLAVSGARRNLAWLLWSTVALAAVLALWVSGLGSDASDSSGRLLGVVAILDVLGTVVLVALAVFGSDGRTLTISVPAPIAARLRKQSADTGRPVRDLVDEALAHYYGLPLD
jgi:hypothetical protein